MVLLKNYLKKKKKKELHMLCPLLWRNKGRLQENIIQAIFHANKNGSFAGSLHSPPKCLQMWETVTGTSDKANKENPHSFSSLKAIRNRIPRRRNLHHL